MRPCDSSHRPLIGDLYNRANQDRGGTRMKIDRKVVAIGAAIAGLAAGGVGIAYGIGGGDSEEQVTGPEAERAKAAALESVGGGTVTEIEHQDGDGAGRFEVEVERADGSQVEVYVDGSYDAVGSAGDDDSGAEEEGAEDDD
jgi:hypothetical protein